MYEIFRETDFSSAHRLRGYEGKCESLHGHNWRVRAFVRADILDHLGMVIDFKEIGKALKTVAERLDHTDLNTIPPFDTINPSAENISRYFFDELGKLLDDERVRVTRVMVWESDKSCAIYSE